MTVSADGYTGTEDTVDVTEDITMRAYTLEAMGEEVASGTCGENVVWTLYDNGFLIISGSGDMDDYTLTDNVAITAWYDYRDNIQYCIIKEGVTSVGRFAFSVCTALEGVEIPETVACIGAYAFSYCISLPDTVTFIDEMAFESCESLETIELPEGLEEISESTFDCCYSLKSIIIPDSVETIDECAFYDCVSLESILLPLSLSYIGESAFESCRSLADVYYSGTAAKWSEIKIEDDNTELEEAEFHYGASEIG